MQLPLKYGYQKTLVTKICIKDGTFLSLTIDLTVKYDISALKQ